MRFYWQFSLLGSVLGLFVMLATILGKLTVVTPEEGYLAACALSLIPYICAKNLEHITDTLNKKLDQINKSLEQLQMPLE